MSDLSVQPSTELAPALSQWQRVVNTFTAPSKTFEDIKAGHKSWWMPFVIITLVGYIFFAAVSMKIGMQTAVDNQIRMDAKAQERLANATPEQKATAEKISVYFTKGIFVAQPGLVLLSIAVMSLVLMGTINFIFGGKATFGSIFAVWMFAALPSIVKTLLGVIVIFAGSAPESFNLKNFSPTNIGAFLNPADVNKGLYSLATSLDVVTIWTLVLLGMGTAIVAGVKRSSGYAAVFGWWLILVLIGAGYGFATN